MGIQIGKMETGKEVFESNRVRPRVAKVLSKRLSSLRVCLKT